MYQPNYQLNHRIINALCTFEVEKTKIECIELDQNRINNLIFENKNLTFFHLAKLIGSDITINQAEKITKGQDLESDERHIKLLINYRSTLEIIKNSVKGDYVIFDLNFPLHLNKNLIYSLYEAWDARYLNPLETSDKEFDPMNDLKDKSIENPKVALADLIEFYRYNKGKVHPMILIANFINRIYHISPFLRQNLVTNIALIEYLIMDSKIFPYEYFNITEIISLNESDIMETIIQNSNQNDESQWIEKFIKMSLENIIGIKDRIGKIQEEQKVKKDQPFLDLNPRQLKILRYLQNIPTIRREEYCEMLDVSTMTAYRDLTNLLDKKLLRVEGEGRGTKYMLITR